MLMLHVAWLGTVFALGWWWSRLALRQSSRISELEQTLGIVSGDAHLRMERMIYWESAAFLAFLVLSTSILAIVYWREVKRTKLLQGFFAGITHELRTPLTSIRLQAESIAESVGEDRPESKLVRRLLEDTSRLESRVETTLSLARIEGGQKLLTQPLPMQPNISRVVDSWLEARRDRVEVRNELKEDWVQANQEAIHVILRNLLENGLRHGKKDPLHVRLKSEKQDGVVCLTYQDDGRGPEESRRQFGGLFEKGAESQGTGVGLYLVRTLMKGMGGYAEFGQSEDREFAGFQARLYFQERQR